MTLYLVRHPQPDVAPGLCYGASDVPITEAELAHVFDSFYTTKAEGMGMGLAICRSIAEAHGGRIDAEQNQPRGAVFQLTVPVERHEPSTAAPSHF